MLLVMKFVYRVLITFADIIFVTFVEIVFVTFVGIAFVILIDTLSVAFIVSSCTIFESSATLFEYLPFSQIDVLGFQL